MPHEIRYEGFPVRSPEMIKVFNEVADYARQGYPVVLFGPSGSGKEFLARYYFDNYMSCFPDKGRFESFNCANLMDTTSVVELFGSVPGIYTNATDRSGLLEDLKLGVLFLDEVGDLGENVQPMLLRAMHINPEKREGRRLGAKKSYQIDTRLCIICATEKPKENIRESLLNRMGAIINVPGMNDRPEDVEPAMIWMFQKSLRSIRNYYALLKKLDYNSQRKSIKSWEEFSLAVSGHLLLLVLSKEWKGNFRTLNAVINQSVIRSANSSDYIHLFDNTVRFFQEILINYTNPLSGIFPSVKTNTMAAGVVKSELFDNTCTKVAEIFPRMDNSEMVKIAEFLIRYSSLTFKRTDFEVFVGAYKTARTAQKRLRELINSNMVTETEKGFYQVKSEETAQMILRHVHSFNLPDHICTSDATQAAVDEILPLIRHSKGIFISTNGNEGMENLATCLGNALKNTYPVYYFEFGTTDVLTLVEAVKEEIINQKNIPGFEETWNKTNAAVMRVAFLSGYFEQLAGTANNPVFILEGVNRLFSTEQNTTLLDVIQFWPFFRFVLIGDKMGNEFDGFTEFKVQ
jgi:hypothetical protein